MSDAARRRSAEHDLKQRSQLIRRDAPRQLISRRTLLKQVRAAGLTAVTYPIFRAGGRAATRVQTPPTRTITGTELTFLQWSHFVPRYDQWFDQFVAEWGEANGVTTRVDHINVADMPAAIAAEVGAGEGHDVLEHVAPLPHFEPSLLDLTDVVQEASARHGEQLLMAKANSFNPTTEVYYGLCHGYAPDPGNYRKSLWENVGALNGPMTWDELLAGGSRIKAEQGVQLGIGMSNEGDSAVAAEALLWAYGAAIQDENENVVINSPETVAAVEYMAKLFKGAMTPEVFGWNAASNNQLLVAGRASYILNSISAYRTAQKNQPAVADDIFFTAPLVGPAGPERALAHAHVALISMIPQHARNADTAKEFLLHLVNNYAMATMESEVYNLPAWSRTVPDLLTEGLLSDDPYGSVPADKLAMLNTVEEWAVNFGWPGPANPAIGEVFATYVLPNMMAKAAAGRMTPQAAVTEAEAEIKPIFEKWKKEGLIGGGQ